MLVRLSTAGIPPCLVIVQPDRGGTRRGYYPCLVHDLRECMLGVTGESVLPWRVLLQGRSGTLGRTKTCNHGPSRGLCRVAMRRRNMKPCDRIGGCFPVRIRTSPACVFQLKEAAWLRSFHLDECRGEKRNEWKLRRSDDDQADFGVSAEIRPRLLIGAPI